ncbi:hypothetical protein Pla100_33650 [Neorhodopirellula pilleata]|uniref:Uncharacterized protein n=1 Tax=Neorhodopirellula pilleata TaxID=2714738 RepID=A0A5C6ABL5_9BACT|nr:hypothetical protein Pla100_33650 [Neorhodopirellula pilleata]
MNQIELNEGDVSIRSGHRTDPGDGGRPVALIAAALEVDEQVFRDAFSRVQPAEGGPPSSFRARVNKKVLMDALSPHGVTNDRLDEVSDYYRYRPESGELWTHRQAEIQAVIEDGQLIGLTLVDGGAGYTCPPEVSVIGFEQVQIESEIEFTADLSTNGRIKSVRLAELPQI